MKLLLTVHQFFPEFGAGTEVLTLSVARELRRRGHEVFIYTGAPTAEGASDDGHFDRYEVDGIPVFRFHHADRRKGGQVSTELAYHDQLANRHFEGLLRSIAPDVVHFFHLGRLGAGLIDLAQHAGIPAYYTPTDFWAVCHYHQLMLEDGTACPGPTPMAGNCVRHIALVSSARPVATAMRIMPVPVVEVLTAAAARGGLPDHRLVREAAATAARKGFIVERINKLQGIFSPTHLMTETLLAHGVRRELISDVAYGIELAGLDRVPPLRPKAPGEGLVVGFIGTLLPHKGAHVLVEAFAKHAPPAARLEIFGNLTDSPEYVERLRKLAGGSGAIHLRGKFPYPSLADVLAGIDVLVVPSLWHENTPLVVYAALAAGRPVVASGQRGITEVVGDERNGLVFEPGSVEALAVALQRLAGDPALLARLAANCEPPKSVHRYVTELLEAYARDVSPSLLAV